MSTEIEVYAAASLPDRWNYAQAMAQAADLVPKGMRTNGVPSPGKIFYTFETGAMLGIHPVAAIQGVNVIEGKPTLSPALMSAVIRRAGHIIRVKVTGQLADLSLQATAELIRSDDPDFTFSVTWTIEKAQRAGLLTVVDGAIRARSERGQPLPWEKYTEALLKARALSEVCREGATDALMGVAYVPEELGANVDEQGEIILDATAPDNGARRQPPSADDYRPIALVPDPPTDTPVANPPAIVVGETPNVVQTDPDMVTMYTLDGIASVEEARQAFLRARQNGHLDRVVDGLPLGLWLENLATLLADVQQNLDRQSEVGDTPPVASGQ